MGRQSARHPRGAGATVAGLTWAALHGPGGLVLASALFPLVFRSSCLAGPDPQAAGGSVCVRQEWGAGSAEERARGAARRAEPALRADASCPGGGVLRAGRGEGELGGLAASLIAAGGGGPSCGQTSCCPGAGGSAGSGWRPAPGRGRGAALRTRCRLYCAWTSGDPHSPHLAPPRAGAGQPHQAWGSDGPPASRARAPLVGVESRCGPSAHGKLVKMLDSRRFRGRNQTAPGDQGSILF